MRTPLLALTIALLLAACSEAPEEYQRNAPEIEFRIDGTLDIVRGDGSTLTLDIEIADTDSLRERGMMERTSFPPSTGMLFTFDTEEMQTFWMGNTPLALDLVFIDADSQIVSIAKYAKPYSDDPIPSTRPAQYVLELPAGYSDGQGLIEGDRVRWTRNAPAQ